MSTLRDLRNQTDAAWDAVIWRMLADGPPPPGVSPAEARELVDAGFRVLASKNTVASAVLVFSHVRRLLAEGGLAEDASPETWRELGEFQGMLFRWKCAGYPVLTLSEPLAAALYLTDVAPLPADLWQLPHDPIVVQLPSPCMLRISSSDGSSIREAPVVLAGSVRGFDREVSARLGLERHRADAAASLEICARHEREAVTRRIVRLLPEPMVNFTTVFGDRGEPRDGETFGAWSARYSDEIEPLQAHVVATEDDGTSISHAWRILMSLWQYLEELAPSPPGAALPSLDRLQSYREGKGRTYRLGREIRIDAPRAALASIGTAGWKVHSRFVVRGHWRNQAVGPGRADHRRMWVKPFWKGPRTAEEVLERAYRVGGDGGSAK